MMTDIRDGLMQAFQFRHACKLFDAAKKIRQADLDYILEAGRLSPSSMGLEHWKFVVVLEQPLKDELRIACSGQQQLSSCSVAIVILAKTAELAPDSEYIATMLRRFELPEPAYQSMLQFYREHVSGFNIAEWSVAQCHIAAANMMTAAAALRIDSCPIGAFDPAQVKKLLAIDESRYQVALVLPFGYRVNPQPPKHRLPLTDLVEYR